MLGPHKIVVEPIGFLSRQSQYLLRSWRKIVHGFLTHSVGQDAIVGLVCPALAPQISSGSPVAGSRCADVRATCLHATGRVHLRKASQRIAFASAPAVSAGTVLRPTTDPSQEIDRYPFPIAGGK